MHFFDSAFQKHVVREYEARLQLKDEDGVYAGNNQHVQLQVSWQWYSPSEIKFYNSLVQDFVFITKIARKYIINFVWHSNVIAVQK